MEETNREIRNLKWLERLGGTIEEDSKDEPRDSLPEEGDPHRRERKNHKMLSNNNINSGKPPSETGGQEKEREAPRSGYPSVLPPPGGLPQGCSPVEWVALRWEEVSKHRELFCPQSGDCVEYAALKMWQAFSCTQCNRRYASKGDKK